MRNIFPPRPAPLIILQRGPHGLWVEHHKGLLLDLAIRKGHKLGHVPTKMGHDVHDLEALRRTREANPGVDVRLQPTQPAGLRIVGPRD